MHTLCYLTPIKTINTFTNEIFGRPTRCGCLACLNSGKYRKKEKGECIQSKKTALKKQQSQILRYTWLLDFAQSSDHTVLNCLKLRSRSNLRSQAGVTRRSQHLSRSEGSSNVDSIRSYRPGRYESQVCHLVKMWLVMAVLRYLGPLTMRIADEC